MQSKNQEPEWNMINVSARVLCMLVGTACVVNGFIQIRPSGGEVLPLERVGLRRNFQKCRSTVWPTMSAPQSIPAASAIAVASLTGFVFDRKLLPNSGIVVTLGLSAFISNTLKIVPTAHVFYDYCWSVILPMSFVLLLIAMEPPKKASKSTQMQLSVSSASTLESRVTKKVGLAFLVASIGSVLGCLVSFKLCCIFPTLFGVNVDEAAQVASCLVASYVGGSINFFATAASIPSLNRPLLTAMATADIIVMAMYFAGLTLASNAPSLQRLFTRGRDRTSPLKQQTKRNHVPPISFTRTGLLSLIVLLLSSMFTATAKLLEYCMVPIVPGTSYAFLALAVPWLMRRLSTNYKPNFVQRLRRVAEPLSEFTFLSLFASIGASVDVRGTIHSGPSCLAISLIALCCHTGVTLLGSVVLIKDCRLDDVLVASNAAIGGPATAAAFGGRYGVGYSIAGALWGIVGYGVGTTLGTTMYRLLVK